MYRPNDSDEGMRVSECTLSMILKRFGQDTGLDFKHLGIGCALLVYKK